MDTNRPPLMLGPTEGEVLWCVGALTTVKAAAEQTVGAYSLIEDLALKGAGTPLHRHQEDDEAFYVLDGEMTFYLGNDEPTRAPAGDKQLAQSERSPPSAGVLHHALSR